MLRLRISSRDIVKIKEKEREEIEAREREEKEKKEEKERERLFSSNKSEALKLYKKGNDPIDVTIH